MPSTVVDNDFPAGNALSTSTKALFRPDLRCRRRRKGFSGEKRTVVGDDGLFPAGKRLSSGKTTTNKMEYDKK